MKTQAEIALKKIKTWFQFNELTLNVDKTKYMPFTTYQTGLPNLGYLDIDMTTKIPEVDRIKYLGIIIDRHLKWDLQAKNIANKLRELLSRFKYLRDILDIHHLKMLYFSLVQSQLSYGISGWGGVYDCHIENVNVLQRWILRIIYQKSIRFPSDELYVMRQVINLRQLYCLTILLYLKRNEHILERLEHTHDTRHKQNTYNLPKREKTIGQHCFDYLGPKILSRVPIKLQNIEGYKSFRCEIKKWILSKNRDFFQDIINKI